MMDVAARLSWRLRFVFLIALALSLAAVAPAQMQHKYPGRGAVSAQELSRLLSPAAVGTTAADQLCGRSTTGSTISDPPALQSQNGVLEVTMKFLTVTASQGLVRYCYVTERGLEAPTLVVNPGDKLIIHFQNALPAATAVTGSDNMASMTMSLANQTSVNAPITIG